MRGNPDDPTEIRKLTGKYDPGVYAYYSSYSAATVKEMRLANSVWKSASVLVGGVALVFALGVFLWRPWTSLADPAKTPQVKSPSKVTAPSALASPPTPEPVPVKVWVIGSGGIKGKYYYFLADGKMLTAQEISAKYGVTVTEVKDGPYYRLVGEGVEYGSGGN